MSDVSVEAIIWTVSKWAAGEPLIRRVYLFGSRARGDHRPDSDIDLAIVNNIDTVALATAVRSKLWPDGVADAATVLLARDDTFRVHQERWRCALDELFDVSVHLERSIRSVDPVWRSLKRRRVLLYLRTTA